MPRETFVVKQTQQCQMHLCESHSAVQLTDSVNSYLKEGWRLHGNLVIIPVANAPAGQRAWFMQAVVITGTVPSPT